MNGKLIVPPPERSTAPIERKNRGGRNALGANMNAEFVRRYGVWLVNLHYSSSTIQRYTKAAREFCGLLRNRDVDETTEWDIRKFLILKSQNGSQYGMLYNALGAIRNFFDFLSLGGITQGIPMRTVRMKAPPDNPPVVASPGMVLRLIAAARTPRERAAVELLYNTGCRVGELARIKVEDIDFDSRKIQVTGKFGKSRYVVFGSRAAHAMKALLRGRTTGYLIQPEWVQRGTVYRHSHKSTSHKGTWTGEISVYNLKSPPARTRITMQLGRTSEISRSEAWSLFKRRIRGLDTSRPEYPRPLATRTVRVMIYRLALRAGMRKITPQELRHCFATHMLDGGADIREIQELLGHTALTVTQRYTHVARERLLSIFNRCHPRGGHYRAGKGRHT